MLTAFFLVVFFFLREIPAYFFLGFWILFQAIEGGIELTHPSAGGGVAFFAHIGGFVFGFVGIRFMRARAPVRPAY